MKGFFWLIILYANIVFAQDNCNNGTLLDYATYSNNYSLNNVNVPTRIECLSIKYVAATSNGASFKEFMESARLTSTGTSINDYKKGVFRFSKSTKNFSMSFDAISQDERIKVTAFGSGGSVVPFSAKNSDSYINGYHTNNSVKVLTLSYNNAVDSIIVELTGLTGPSYNAYANVTFTNGCTNCLTTLPIELLDFTATIQNNRAVLLDWTTNVERNNDYFNIERSVNGVDWEQLSNIQGAGNSEQRLNYYWTDSDPVVMGISYYRLKQVDFNGQFTHSKIVTVTTLDIDAEMNVFPNPFKNTLTVVGSLMGSLKMIDLLGNDCTSKFTVLSTNEHQVLLDASSVSSGVYFIVVGEKSVKLIKN